MMEYLQRYKNGEYEAVWSELIALGADIRTNEIVYQDAQAVAVETMQRVQQNVVELLAQLRKMKYVFTTRRKKYSPPAKNVEEYIEHIEDIAGFVPLSIKSFMSIVGSVNLTGYFPELDEHGNEWGEEILPDPLVFEYPLKYFRSTFNSWSLDVSEFGIEEIGEFLLEFAPDEYHKENISGGAPYSIKLPNSGIDTFVENEWHKTAFVEYLRDCFHWGGFPGLCRASHPPYEQIRMLTQRLIPF